MPKSPQYEVDGAAVPKSADEEGDKVGGYRDQHPPFGDGQPVQQRNHRFEDVDF